jgi:hypothetical protein
MDEDPIHGLPPDEMCLHCQLVPLLQQHRRLYPQKDVRAIIGEILYSACELIAQTSVDMDRDIFDARALVREYVRAAHDDLVKARRGKH